LAHSDWPCNCGEFGAKPIELRLPDDLLHRA
jgi:hypothetical protein